MALLWPDWPPAAAHKNLRQNLYTLRQVLPVVAARDGRGPVPLVLADHDTLQLNPDAAVDPMSIDSRPYWANNSRRRRLPCLSRRLFGRFLPAHSGPFEEWRRRADGALMLAARSSWSTVPSRP
jgi:DNA-binding SARP family transcriptional activator